MHEPETGRLAAQRQVASCESRGDIRALISLKMTQCWYPGEVGGGLKY